MLAVFLFAAAALRLYRISDKDVWLDEANAVLMAEKPLGELMGALQLDSNPPLYYLMLHYWMGAFGNSEFAIRSLSACCGALLVAGAITWDVHNKRPSARSRLTNRRASCVR